MGRGGREGRAVSVLALPVRGGRGGVLVDAGSDPEEIERLRTSSGSRRVVMTHYHEDHFTFLSRLPDTPVGSSAADAPALESLETLLAWYGVLGNEWEDFYRNLFEEKFPFVRGRSRGGSRTGRSCASAGRARSPSSPRPHARAPVPPFPRRRDPVPRRLRPDGVRPVVRRHAVRHRRVPEVRPPPRLDPADRYVVSHEGPVHRGPIGEKMSRTSR